MEAGMNKGWIFIWGFDESQPKLDFDWFLGCDGEFRLVGGFVDLVGDSSALVGRFIELVGRFIDYVGYSSVGWRLSRIGWTLNSWFKALFDRFLPSSTGPS